MHLCEIAPELQLEILQFCPPRDLASLSTVHTSLRDVAEHALYSHIDFLIRPSDFIQDWHYNEGSLLHTLSTSARKSVMVKEVYIRFLGRDYWSQRASGGSNSEDWHPAVIMMYISDTLKKLPNLAELGIAYPWCGDPSGGQLSQVLRFVFIYVIPARAMPICNHRCRGGHFQLHMIWIDEAQDFRGIIANQPNLRFLGGFHNDQQLWGTIEGLAQNASCTMPTIVMLNFLYPRLDIYPSTHRPGQVRGECREIIRSLRKFTWDSLLGYHLTFNLWSIEEDIGLFNEVMKEIAICLKTCSHLIVECLEIQVHDLRKQVWSSCLSKVTRVYHPLSRGTSHNLLNRCRFRSLKL